MISGITAALGLSVADPRLEHAARFVGTRRALIFLVSDFHFPLPLCERVMSSLAYHDVVPVVVWDRHEFERLPDFGLVRMTDPESGQRLG